MAVLINNIKEVFRVRQCLHMYKGLVLTFRSLYGESPSGRVTSWLTPDSRLGAGLRLYRQGVLAPARSGIKEELWIEL